MQIDSLYHILFCPFFAQLLTNPWVLWFFHSNPGLLQQKLGIKMEKLKGVFLVLPGFCIKPDILGSFLYLAYYFRRWRNPDLFVAAFQEALIGILHRNPSFQLLNVSMINLTGRKSFFDTMSSLKPFGSRRFITAICVGKSSIY